MALIDCPECGKKISESTSSCPHCGYKLSTDAVSIELPPPTEIGELKKSVSAGIGCAIGSIACIIIGIPFIGLFGLGIFLIVGGFLLFGASLAYFSGTSKVTCPFCGRNSSIAPTAGSFKCPTCKKRSIRDGNYLKPIP